MKSLIRFVLLYTFLSANLNSSFAQESLVFHDNSEGLSQNTVVSIVQDNEGFLWVATHYGLNRYDGHTYKYVDIVEANENPSKSNQLNCLAYDSLRNELWIGSYGSGLIKLNLDTYETSHFDSTEDFLSDNYITDLYIDQNELLWISTEKAGISLLRLNEKDQKYNSSIFNVSQLEEDYITCVTGKENIIVMGTWSSGLIVLNKETGVITSALDTDVPIRCVVAGKKNEFYIGTNHGLKKIQINLNGKIDGFNIIHELNNTVILSLLLDSQSKLFIGTENEGLYTLNKGVVKKYLSNTATLNQISGNSIWSLYQDRSGVTWIGLYLKGLNKIDNFENKFKKIQKFQCSNRNVELDLASSIIETKEHIWIGTDGSGLYSQSKKDGSFECYDFGVLGSNQAITALEAGNNNKLWIGMWKDGIIRYDHQTKTHDLLNSKHTGDLQLSGDFIHTLQQDQNGKMWVSCLGDGIDILDNNKRIKTFGNRDLLSTKVRVITEHCTGEMILGTEENGIQLLTLDEDYNIIKTKTLLSDETTNFSYAVNDVKVDANCNIWVATTNGLVGILTTYQEPVTYTTKNDLPSNYIAAIEFDDEGMLWATTNQGIFALDLSTDKVASYGQQDGLLSNEFIGGSSTKTENGNIYFGNTLGINYYNSDQLVFNEQVPPVVITSITVSGQEIDSIHSDYKYFSKTNKKVDLHYKQNDLAFKFSAINFSQSKLNQFKIRLKGQDKEWQDIEERRKIEYRNLQPGTYTFQVLGSNNNQVWNETPAEFTFCIEKAWYNSLVAWIIYTLLFCSLIYYVARSIITRFKLREELRIEHLEIAKLKELSDLRSQFFANISHELITPLTMIISPLKGTKDSDKQLTRENTQVMLSNAERLMQYINQILSLAKLESKAIKLNVGEYNFIDFTKTVIDKFQSLANNKGCKLDLIVENSSIPLFYDEEKMEQVLSNLLSNAIKYSKDKGHIIVRIQNDSAHIKMEVTDNGIGIEDKNIDKIFDRYFRENEEGLVSGIGIGLSIVKQLVELHKGNISIESKKGQYTTFMIVLPKGRSHFDDLEVGEGIKFINTGLALPDLSPTSSSNPIELIEGLPIILLVEDNPDIANYIITYFKDIYNVEWAENGQVGIDTALAKIPDVIISDVMMPLKNGYQLCQELKSNELTSHISIILLTVKSSDNSQIKGYEYGADFYMIKPFSPQLLRLRIDNIIKHDREIAAKLQKFNINTNSVLATEASNLDKQFLERSMNLVIDNLSNSKFSVIDLAKGLDYSKGQLYRKLKSVINQSPNEYIRTIRLNQAASLLKESQFNVSEITYKVGFNDLKYFRSCFKKQFGINPSEYKSSKISV